MSTKKSTIAPNPKRVVEPSSAPLPEPPKSSSDTIIPNLEKPLHKLKKLYFQLRYKTAFGQSILMVGDHELLGNNQFDKAIPLNYFNDDYWFLEIDFPADQLSDRLISYHYILKNADGTFSEDWGDDKSFNPAIGNASELQIVDTWNYAGYYENTFYTVPFKKVLLKQQPFSNHKVPQNPTHTFSVKAPLLAPHQTVCLLGSTKAFASWDTQKPLLLNKELDRDDYFVQLDLSNESFPVAYKYGVYDFALNEFIRFEDGNNRILPDLGNPNRNTILHDGFVQLPNNTFKGTGIAIPVFSLRSDNGFGIGEFYDIPALVDWSEKVGIKMVQLLPINDTISTKTYLDSYPYAAISAFALHPMYLNMDELANTSSLKEQLKQLLPQKKLLNDLEVVDYLKVNEVKLSFLKMAYQENKGTFLTETSYHSFFADNQHWLEPYAVFCYLRDLNGTVEFEKWPSHSLYRATEIKAMVSPTSATFDAVAFYYFVQYHLHLQLKKATAYAHEHGVIVKGDIAIGVYRNGVDAWQNPELYHLDFQAGAPPDDFAIKGQNWGFPTYNWQRMQQDGFAWWKQRFEQMGNYFDAFRIDHILGFFRIWSIPMHAVEGIMGHFVPAIPVHVHELNAKQIWFDYARFTKPFINDNVLWELFGYDNEQVKSNFLNYSDAEGFSLKPAFATQRQVEKYFEGSENDAYQQKLKNGLFNLISNVIFFESDSANGMEFHFRFGMESTSSFRHFDASTQDKLKELYVDYFFKRQDDFWMKEAMKKLPALKKVTNMMVCGEDLGLVPTCVPAMMQQLGFLSLEIQRMPKDSQKSFFHPNDAPYLSVVTPSTHDMSTIRGWWEEDHQKTQQFYNHELGQWGNAPYYCEAWINRAVVVQHLYSPAMWAVFQLQDLLGIDASIRRENPQDERINVPANPKHYWQYRMHLSLDQLLTANEFNFELSNFIQSSGR